jgi:hypothetical protein
LEAFPDTPAQERKFNALLGLISSVEIALADAAATLSDSPARGQTPLPKRAAAARRRLSSAPRLVNVVLKKAGHPGPRPGALIGRILAATIRVEAIIVLRDLKALRGELNSLASG